ncbi:MAG: YIP1 family protein [Mariprofundaceae bacterium]|nr:YIP1 family protein [Mariprofundaceae bacterium]
MPRFFSSDHIGDTLLAAFKGVMISPPEYFSAMPQAHAYRNSLTLLLIYLSIPALMAGMLTGVVTLVFILPLSLLFGLIGTWFWAAYLGWAARRFCASELSTEDAFQICAYSSAPLVFSWIPIIGLLAWLSNIYLNWQGLVSHARIGAGAALLIILGAYFMMFLSLIALAALMFYTNVSYDLIPLETSTWF